MEHYLKLTISLAPPGAVSFLLHEPTLFVHSILEDLIMKVHTFAVPFLVALLFLIAGCKDEQGPSGVATTAPTINVPLAKTATEPQSLTDNAVLHEKDDDDAGDNDSEDATYTVHLKAMAGLGSGTVRVTPVGGTIGFSAWIGVEVRHMKPNASFFLQRAPEIGRPLGSDGIGQRALGLYPWEQPNSPGFPPAPAFITFPIPNAGPLVMINTDKHGKGGVKWLFNAPSIPDGTLFDVVFRVVDAQVNPTIELQTKCFTVTVL